MHRSSHRSEADRASESANYSSTEANLIFAIIYIFGFCAIVGFGYHFYKKGSEFVSLFRNNQPTQTTNTQP